MVATPADIAAGTRAASVATWSNATIQARYPTARDGSKEPDAGYFDAIADAQTVIDARGALIGVERRRFAALIDDLVWPDPTLGLPARTLVDSEQAVNAAVLVSRVAVNLESEQTTEELFG
ncbi:hypothetical protein ACFB49_42490 [Sphingomonas sp. DBB INV C78]|uniref:hypothetical protein n=1 Tax=Sphingomonas sp. DBB INV C78 TaxID=3349434 RepID=UPI0036D29F15